MRIALPSIPACIAMLGTGGVGVALVHGTVPAESLLAWPLVVLALGAMAYDIGLRALRRSSPLPPVLGTPSPVSCWCAAPRRRSRRRRLG